MTPSRVKRARRHIGDTAVFTVSGDAAPVSARIVSAPLVDGTYVLVFQERNRARTQWEVNFTDIVTPIRYGA
jgi:hypothetical protein